MLGRTKPSIATRITEVTRGRALFTLIAPSSAAIVIRVDARICSVMVMHPTYQVLLARPYAMLCHLRFVRPGENAPEKLRGNPRYNYNFSNAGDAVVIAWDPLTYKAFAQAAKPALPNWDAAGPLPLSAGQKINVAFEAQKPRLVIATVALIDNRGKMIATAVAPTYVPASQ